MTAEATEPASGGDDPPPPPPDGDSPAVDVSQWSSYDSETRRFADAYLAPKIVLASSASFGTLRGRGAVGELHVGESAAIDALAHLLDVPCECSPRKGAPGQAALLHEVHCPRRRRVIAFAFAAYDLAVVMQARPEMRWAIFQALRDGRIHDVLLAESLHAIHGGHLGMHPSGAPLRAPSTGEVTTKYSLDVVSYLTLGRRDAKEGDAWRMSYALADGFPESSLPPSARKYPVDDVLNTLDSAVAQVLGPPGKHDWKGGVCALCGERPPSAPTCPAAPRRPPHDNLDNLAPQVEVDFCFRLGAASGFRVDGERLDALAVEVEQKHRAFVERFKKKGWYRDNGTEDQAAVKRAIAEAYGAGSGNKCQRCGGTGRVDRVKQVPCRGDKVSGRYLGCLGQDCGVCFGSGKLSVTAGKVTCKNEFDKDDALVTKGCDGTGYDLDSVRSIPRTDKLGVKTDRDATMESGDEDLAEFGENQFEKSRTTYVPYLRTGVRGPLSYDIDALKETGRASVQGSPLHQMPRAGKERRCIRARGAWCGSLTEYLIGSTDYSAGELCTLAEGTYALFGYSRMRDAILASKDPGILHSELAAEVMGISLQDFLARLKAKDSQAKYFRQASKPENFGKPAGMGAPKIVLTNRKESAGFTVCEGGPARDSDGREGYHGIRFCILVGGAKSCGDVKIHEWGRSKYPCAPVCKACVEIEAHVLSPAYFRRFPEVKEYHRWVTRMTENGERAPSIAWDPDAQRHRIIRQRGGCEFSAYANNIFQSMLADIIKSAYVRCTRECYLGVTDDERPSPLAGSRLPLVAHDEIISELIEDRASQAGDRISTIMVEEGYRFAPHVVWKADTALMRYWYKAAEPVRVNGLLVPWEPEGDK